MGVLKRAGLYCYRQRVRTLILFLVLTIIATFMVVSIVIRDAATAATVDAKKAIGGKLILEPDTDNHMGVGQSNEWGGETYTYNGDLVTEKMVKAIGDVEGVVDYNSEDKAGFYASGIDFQYLPAAFSLDYSSYGDASSYTATLSSEKCSDFQNGKYKLVDGRHILPDDKHVCLLSKELTDYNKLAVGDKVNMYCMDSDSKMEFEIIGIFDGTEGTSGNALTVDEIPANCGYIDYATMFEMFGDMLDGYQQLTIYVEDIAGIQNVYDKIMDLKEIKGTTLKLSIDKDEYDVVSYPLESLQGLMNNIIITISIVSVIILTLLLTIWIRGRKKEIGVLLSVGVLKAGIIAQLFTETLIVAFFAFISSVLLSNLITNQVGQLLISKVINDTINLNVHISTEYLILLYLIEVVLIAISVAISSWTIIRVQPKDILAKMS